MANGYMKRCLISLIIREMEIKTTMRFSLTPVKMAITESQAVTSVSDDVGKKGTLVHCWYECKLIQPLWQILWRSLKKLKTELPYDLAIPLLGICPKKMRTLI